LIAVLIAVLAGIAGVSALADSPHTNAPSATSRTDAELTAADEMRREGLTKILYGMESTGASEERMASVRMELEQLGGPDPAVEPLDGPDGQEEWELQAKIDAGLCADGSESSCGDLEHSSEKTSR